MRRSNRVFGTVGCNYPSRTINTTLLGCTWHQQLFLVLLRVVREARFWAVKAHEGLPRKRHGARAIV